MALNVLSLLIERCKKKVIFHPLFILVSYIIEYIFLF